MPNKPYNEPNATDYRLSPAPAKNGKSPLLPTGLDQVPTFPSYLKKKTGRNPMRLRPV